MSFVNVRATMLDEVVWFEPFVETCTDYALSWVKPIAQYRYEKFPPVEDYSMLLMAFAEAFEN